MLLTSFVLNNRPCINGHGAGVVKEPFRIEQSPSFGYIDVSSIENWEKYGHRPELKRDYSYVRSEIKQLVKQRGIDTTLDIVDDPSQIPKSIGDRYEVGLNPIGEFANQGGAIATITEDLTFVFEDAEGVGYRELSDTEKEIAARYNLGYIDDHERDFDPKDVLSWNAEYHVKSTQTRIKRRLYAETLVYRDLPFNGNDAVGAMVYSPVGNLVMLYTDYGQKGTVEDKSALNPTPNPGMCDYLMSRSVFAPEGNFPGLSAQPWIPRQGSLKALVERIYNVLVYGIYE